MSVARLADVNPVEPPVEGLGVEPIIRGGGVVRGIRPDRIVAHRFEVLIAVGIAVVGVAGVR